MQLRGVLAVAASLALPGCVPGCLGPHPIFPVDPQVAMATPAEAPPPPEPSPPVERCAFEESQRLTRLLERERAAELRELADRVEDRSLAMVPLSLQYDGAGQVEDARLRIPGHDAFAHELAQAAKGWRLDGVHRAAICELAVQLPRSAEPPPDAGEAPEAPEE